MKNLCRSKGGHANVYKSLHGGRGVQKVQKLVYVVYGWHLFKTNPLIPKTPHEQKDLPFRGGVQAAEL